jgi:hypothetical protein
MAFFFFFWKNFFVLLLAASENFAYALQKLSVRNIFGVKQLPWMYVNHINCHLVAAKLVYQLLSVISVDLAFVGKVVKGYHVQFFRDTRLYVVCCQMCKAGW